MREPVKRRGRHRQIAALGSPAHPKAWKVRHRPSDNLLTPVHLPGWRMAGGGGFRAVSDGVIESFGGPGLFWYANDVFDNFVLTIEWRLNSLHDNSGVFLRC